MKKGIIALAGMIIVLGCLFIALFGPWYTIDGSAGPDMGFTARFYLTRIDINSVRIFGTLSLSLSYSEALENLNVTVVNKESFTTVNTAMVLTVFALLTGTIAMIGMAAFVFKKGKPKMMKFLGGGFGILTFILSIIPPLYFMSTGFAQNTSGFWFSQNIFGMTLIGGPGYAWYLMIVAAIIAVISAVTILLKKIEPSKVATTESVAPPTS
jgi:uncharacterized membrane protein required for colicin V production